MLISALILPVDVSDAEEVVQAHLDELGLVGRGVGA